MTQKRFFITGTDTEVGKTLVSSALLLAGRRAGHSCYGMKPIAAGAHLSEGKLGNEDAEALQRCASSRLDYAQVNPYCFSAACAPHIAAKIESTSLDRPDLLQRCQNFPPLHDEAHVDWTIIEGCGGWSVPLSFTDTRDHTHPIENNDLFTMADLVEKLANQCRLEVILVVGLKLGCINHALLSAEAIHARGLKIAAWVGCQTQADFYQRNENIHTLKVLLRHKRSKADDFSLASLPGGGSSDSIPCLGIIPFREDFARLSVIQQAEVAEQYLRLNAIVN